MYIVHVYLCFIQHCTCVYIYVYLHVPIILLFTYYLSLRPHPFQICRILGNPSLLRSMIQGTQLANNEVLIRKSYYHNLLLLSLRIISFTGALGNRQLIAELSNPDSLQE